MLRVSFQRIKAEKEPRLRAWLAELSARADEARATFIDESVRHEQAFIVQTAGGPVLVYATEAADFECGREAFARSKHAIDREHKQILKECLAERLDVEPLYDVALALDPQDGVDS